MALKPTSTPLWATNLTKTLTRLASDKKPPRVALLGVGHELNGDDAAGLILVRALREQVAARDDVSDRLLLLEGGPAPENQTGALRAFAPALVLLIDAAQMGTPPGSVRWLDWEQISGVSASTHTMPLHMLARFLTLDLGCEVALLGLQPYRNGIAQPLSDHMRAVIDHTARQLFDILMALHAANEAGSVHDSGS